MKNLEQMVDVFYKKSQVLGLGQSAMTPSYMVQLAQEILNVLSQQGAPTVKEVDWENRPVIRDALQRIIKGESIEDIRDDAVNLMRAQNYWNFLSRAGYSSKLAQLLKAAQ